MNQAVIRIGGRTGMNVDPLRGWNEQADGDASTEADRLDTIIPLVVRLVGSDAQREVVEDT